MPKYVIEREIPGAGNLPPEKLQAVSQTSCNVLDRMKKDIEWIHSYVTDDKVCCIYEAVDKNAIREHVRLGNFPANSTEETKTIINPATAGGN